MKVKDKFKELGVHKTIDLLEKTGRLEHIYMFFSGIHVAPQRNVQGEEIEKLISCVGCGFLLRCLEDSFAVQGSTGNLLMDDILELYYLNRNKEKINV